MAALITGLSGGLTRLPVLLPASMVHANWVILHGPLMVCGFLGTVIGIERAVGLRLWWPWIAPVFTAIGAVALIAGSTAAWPLYCMVAASGCFLAVNWKIHRLQPVLSNAVMAAGALAWLIGNVRWAEGGPVPQVVLWWLAFLLLTITGERIQLTRFRKPSKWSKPWLFSALGLLAAGLSAGSVPTLGAMRAGGMLTGIGLAVLTGWLATFDIARLTIRHSGLPRFMAACLLGGYAWLMVSAVLIAICWPRAGFLYDASLHAFFVGFVFSMIFGHAPVIFPAVLGLPIRFHPVFHAPVVLMHLALLLRIAADLIAWPQGRTWGGIGNATAIALFLILTLTSILSGIRKSH